MTSEEMAVPGSPAALTAEWLTQVLHEVSVLRDASVADLRTEIIGQEWGFTGVVARVAVRYSKETPDAPHSLVAKFPTATQEHPSLYARAAGRDAGSRQRAYERSAREVHAYWKLLPSELAAAPLLYFAAADPETGHLILLLEDLVGGVPGDVLHGCSPVEARWVCEAIVPLHARWWESQGLRVFPWLPRWGQDSAAQVQRYAECVEPFLHRFGERMPVEARHVVRRLVGTYPRVLMELAAAPPTAIHGDLHLDNVIFMSSIERPARLIDWQGVMRGPAALDLSFIANSLPIDQRRVVEGGLLQHYHAALLARGITTYRYDRLEYHYRLALLSNLAGFVTWLGSADLAGLEGRQRAIVDAVVEEPRLLTALLDHQVGMLLD